MVNCREGRTNSYPSPKSDTGAPWRSPLEHCFRFTWKKSHLMKGGEDCGQCVSPGVIISLVAHCLDSRYLLAHNLKWVVNGVGQYENFHNEKVFVLLNQIIFRAVSKAICCVDTDYALKRVTVLKLIHTLLS